MNNVNIYDGIKYTQVLLMLYRHEYNYNDKHSSAILSRCLI